MTGRLMFYITNFRSVILNTKQIQNRLVGEAIVSAGFAILEISNGDFLRTPSCTVLFLTLPIYATFQLEIIKILLNSKLTCGTII